MKTCFQRFPGIGLLLVAAGLASIPVAAQAQTADCACSCLPRCRLLSRGCASCGDSYENAMADSIAGNYADPANSPFDLGEGAPAQSGSDFAVLQNPGGYIDSAIVGSQFRLRYDAAYNNPMPDRVEFFYGQCGCFGGNAPGPLNAETSVDYQELIPYLEWATSNRFSLFIETPVRMINPDVNQNAGGFSDLNAGFKYALIAHPDEYLTAQLRIYTPTGQPELGLGTGHVSIEPSVLYFRRYNECLTLQAEFRDWIPISNSVAPPNGENFAGNVLRYGVGLGYDIYSCCDECTTKRLTPVGEVVGWTILDGFGFDGNNPAAGAIDQSGTTIVNAKFGLRYTVNEHSFYAGYGTALTNQVWYNDVFRLEYRQAF
jgi:hypothetical protein